MYLICCARLIVMCEFLFIYSCTIRVRNDSIIFNMFTQTHIYWYKPVIRFISSYCLDPYPVVELGVLPTRAKYINYEEKNIYKKFFSAQNCRPCKGATHPATVLTCFQFYICGCIYMCAGFAFYLPP
jgi:hypothetical protein